LKFPSLNFVILLHTQLLQSAKELRVLPLKDPSKGNPNACMLLLGKEATELLAPLWDVRNFESNAHQNSFLTGIAWCCCKFS
jgi:hypothetical protein